MAMLAIVCHAIFIRPLSFHFNLLIVANFTAAILIDPRWAVQLLGNLPEGRERDYAQLTVTRMLTLEGEEFWRQVHSHLALWAPDTED